MRRILCSVFSILLLGGFAVAAPKAAQGPSEGELLYNGIRLPAIWPPHSTYSGSREVTQVPYLESRPATVPISVGRQLFVDDFLIEGTNLARVFHQPVKYEGNPVLKAEADWEMQPGTTGAAVPFSDGVFYDPADRLFKLWYMAGWADGTALAVSKDGLKWERPSFDVVPGTNLVLTTGSDGELRRDGVSVWLDHRAKTPAERFKMLRYLRRGKVGARLAGAEGMLLTSPDGIHWDNRGKTGHTEDNTTFFYNPFRGVWAFSHRTNWLMPNYPQRWRIRSYWDNPDFFAALNDWKGYQPVFWVGADQLDRPDPVFRDDVQMYKVDATPYESLMIGLLQVHYGPDNRVAAQRGIPKLTELKIAFSRDGFHWDRTARDTFLGATRTKESWDRAYIHSAGGVCLVVGDKLYFYYGGFQGDETNRAGTRFDGTDPSMWTGMYANSSTGLAVLRRDGFASMDAGSVPGILTTRPVLFTGKHLFVNVNCPEGALRVEMLDAEGRVIAPFSADKCVAVSADSTLQAIRWTEGDDLSAYAGQRIRFRFHLTRGSLYAFWVSPEKSGASNGYVAAGGPGFTGDTDTVGAASYSREWPRP